MEILKTLFFKKRLRVNNKKDTLNEIRKILTEYSRNQISIIECVSNIGPLTAEMIFKYSSEKTKKSVHDSILNMITNYYIMLHIDMYTGFYAVSRNHTCNLVSSLVEDVLKETAEKQKGFKLNNSYTATHNSRDFTKQMVEVYYWTGIDGCNQFVASSIYSTLRSENKSLSVNRDWVVNIIQATQAEKFLTGNFEDAEFSFVNTG